MTRQLLTAEILPSLVGKTISWGAPSYRGNSPYGGIATITAVNLDERRPIKATTIEGDELWFAFIEKPWTEDYVAYSDADRPVSFEIVD